MDGVRVTVAGVCVAITIMARVDRQRKSQQIP
jgi:hypothetical protein